MKVRKMYVATALIAGLSLIVTVAPMIGEMVATMSPWQNRLESPYEGMVFENVSFPTTEGLTLRGWFFPSHDPAAPAVLYAPATAHDQRQGLSLVAPLHQAGYQVLLFNYRGYGSSDGNPFNFSYGARESFDIDAAVRYLSDTRGIQQIGAIGHSAGAVSIILSAARNPRLDAIVLAAPFTSLQDVWDQNRPSFFPALLYNLSTRLFELRKHFSRLEVRPLEVIGQIAPRPIFFINGLADQRITVEQGSSLFEAAGFPKQIVWLPGASHSQVRSPGLDNLSHQIVAFFDANLHSQDLAALPLPMPLNP